VIFCEKKSACLQFFGVFVCVCERMSGVEEEKIKQKILI
jgi:hypothetical protein